ncbi:MAG: hypothetical protein ACO39R_04730 [Pontimonas sp.]
MERKSGLLTIDTLENMFVYLGCANIPTQDAMDGAIPLESLLNSRIDDSVVSAFSTAKLETMPLDWSAKTVWFSGDNLGLSTVENIHWSRLAGTFNRVGKIMRLSGRSTYRDDYTSQCDGFVRMFYSEIDRYGRFIKFPVTKKYYGSLTVSSLYNPRWVFEIRKGDMHFLSSDSDETFKERRLDFLTPFLCGLAQSLGAYWLVKTKFDEVCPSLTLLTDPTGVKEFWKLRDVPEGKKRRSALLHWVEQHWRQTRKDPDVEAYVREHMRGERRLTLGKFEAEITPSVEDTLTEQKAKEKREMLRKLKQDRRRLARRKTATGRSRKVQTQ